MTPDTTDETTTTYRFDGTHADTMDNGIPVAPGQHVKLTEEDSGQPAASRMLADGHLVAVTYDPDALDTETADAADETQAEAAPTRRTRKTPTTSTTPASSSADTDD